MATATRALDEGTRLAKRQAAEIATEFLERRLTLGWSQAHAARSCHLSRGRYRLIELGLTTTVTRLEVDRIAMVLGLSPSFRIYPGGLPVRDAAHASKLATVLGWVRRPLTYRVEVPLPRADARWEPRAWDAMLFGGGKRSAMELEMRLRDVRAMRRRHDLKRRDDPTDGFLLLVAHTRANRRVLAEFASLFDDLPRLRPTAVRAALERGEHPPTGIVLV